MGENLRKDNLRIDNLRSMITRDINDANLPIGVIYFIIKDVYNEVNNLYTTAVGEEYKEFCELVAKEDAEMAAQESSTEVVEEQSQVEGE